MKTYTNEWGEGCLRSQDPIHSFTKHLSNIYEPDPLRGRTRSQWRMRSAVLERMKSKPGEQAQEVPGQLQRRTPHQSAEEREGISSVALRI